MIFTTVSGSTYQIDEILKRVRRLIGIKDPTPRMGEDGDWREYIDISAIKVGVSVVFVWRIVSDRVETTATSRVKEINPAGN